VSGSEALTNKVSEGLVLGSDLNILIQDPSTKCSLILLLILLIV